MSFFIVAPVHNCDDCVSRTRIFGNEDDANTYFLAQNAHRHIVKCYICNPMPVEVEWSVAAWKHPYKPHTTET